MHTFYKIVIIDDHQIFMDGIESLFKNDEKFKVIAKTSNEIDFLPVLNSQFPDIILLDLNLNGEDGLNLITKILKIHASVKIIIITSYNESNLIENALDLGAKGYVLKSAGKEELTKAMESVLLGNIYKSLDLVSNEKVKSNLQFIKQKYPDEFLKKFNITNRETDVLILMARSLSTKEIAETLGITELTVSTHRKKIKSKLELKNTAALVKFAFENHLLK